ncbi:TetR/AcrR family transcriptional regulator [Tomitella biformata]|uniref:TetR/AcrR family transcriptional regulator n=1 Tax=Tomitella biformata TaxID=630403 RepID=UPI0004632C91|nr:TetR/AcrR family transcriptional regulator [Tomitella biformata]
MTTAGSQHHRDAVQEAAAELFSEQGFAATGVREIAGRAGVDPALVIRYFGSKEKLFLRTMTMSSAFADAMQGPMAHLGESLVAVVIRKTLPPPAPMATGVFVALLRASDRPTVQEHLRESVDEMIVALLAPRLQGPDAELRSRLVSAQITGLMAALFAIEDPGLLAAPQELIARHYGRAIQTLLDN